MVHNLELMPGRGGKFGPVGRGFAQVMAKEGDYVQVRMPPERFDSLNDLLWATVGQVGI